MEKLWHPGLAQYGELWRKLASQLPLPSGIDFSTHFLAFAAIWTDSMPPVGTLVSRDTPAFFTSHWSLTKPSLPGRSSNPYPRASEWVWLSSFTTCPYPAHESYSVYHLQPSDVPSSCGAQEEMRTGSQGIQPAMPFRYEVHLPIGDLPLICRGHSPWGTGLRPGCALL